MYIHSYQMHNVLNVYRKQLSQGTARGITGDASKSRIAQDRINISSDGQRQSLFDKISSEIVARITRFGPETKFKMVLADQLTQKAAGETQNPANSEADGSSKNDIPFTYTLIDEHNRKTTHRLPASQISLPAEDLKSTIGVEKDSDINSDSE